MGVVIENKINPIKERLMRIGIMQPYFFPYIQQFRHIRQCDMWVIFDTPKFSRKSWISRNRIINRNTQWSYISVPIVKGASNSSISKAQIVKGEWKNKFYDSLKVYKDVAPFYLQTMDIIEEAISGKHVFISDLNLNIIKTLCSYLNIKTKIELLSKMSLEIVSSAAPGEWACHISKALKADIYSNAPGGRHIFDPEYYRDNNIILEFYEPHHLKYETSSFNFVEDLSIIDQLMWMGCDSVEEWCHS